MVKHTHSQEDVFASFDWWNKDYFLNQITGERCDYIESCITRVFGNRALEQQQILDVGCGGGLICEELARRKTTLVGIDPSQAHWQGAYTCPTERARSAHSLRAGIR
jgi:2-polyprenyl-6-hydroxyphenyl methylase/3-demethylubiquinone-9 3-methyltransferase